jgi:hypothetical protein
VPAASAVGIDSVVGGDVAERTGGYRVRVTGADGTVTEPIEYELTIRTVGLDRFDPNEDRESATPFESDETIEGVIAGYDHDWFAIGANEGDELSIVYEVVQEVDPFDQALVLHTPDDETVEIDGSEDEAKAAVAQGRPSRCGSTVRGPSRRSRAPRRSRRRPSSRPARRAPLSASP